MKNLMFFIFIIAFLFAFCNAKSEKVDSLTAKIVAKNLYWSRVTSEKGLKYNDIIPELVYTEITKGNNIYYVFNVGENNGFVIVSADDDVVPALGYSLIGSYSTINQPPAFIDWMNHYKEQILYIKENNLQADNKIENEWLKYQTFNPYPPKAKSVLPLITTKWGQGLYYNASCPYDANSQYDNHALVGCVAVAMGQVMKYHSHPTVGTDYWEYDHTIANGYSNDYGTLSANFGATTYNWSNMPDSATTYNSDLATLLYHCGVSAEMDYGPNVSGTWVISEPPHIQDCAEYALKTYFGYDNNLQGIEKANYEIGSQWENILINELDNNRSIIYRGWNSTYTSGHAFVCDGYQGTDYFHFNWGWNGSEGYYYLEDLNPLILYPNKQGAVIGIKPYIPGSTPPTLSNARVEPHSGTESTTYKYLVDYYDPDGDPPLAGNREVYINDQIPASSHVMTLESGTPSNGTYSFSTSSLSASSYQYFFSFTNVIGQNAMTSWKNGPYVYSDGNIIINPVIHCDIISSDLKLGYSLTGLGNWNYFDITGSPTLDQITVSPGGTVWFTAGIYSNNYQYNGLDITHNGNIEQQTTSNTWSITFLPDASGSYTLNAYYEYTPQQYTIT